MVAAAVAHKSAFFITVPLVQRHSPAAVGQRRGNNAVAPHSDPALHAFFWIGDTNGNPPGHFSCIFGAKGAAGQQRFLFAIQGEGSDTPLGQ